MFRRFNLAPEATEILPPGIVTPTEGRELTLSPENADSPEQRVRVISRLDIPNPDQDERNAWRGIVDARTVTVAREMVRIEDITRNILLLNHSFEKAVPQATDRAGRFIIEYPRERPEDPITGDVFVLGAPMTKYGFIEEGDEIRVTSRTPVESHREKVPIPVGSRRTTSVRVKGALSERAAESGIASLEAHAVVADGMSPEEVFVDKLVEAIRIYKENHPTN